MIRCNYIKDEYGYIVIGTAREIKNIENHFRKLLASGFESVVPVFTEPAKYNMDKMYGISIRENEWRKEFVIISDTTALQILAAGLVELD